MAFKVGHMRWVMIMAYRGKFIAVWTMLIMEITSQISVILRTDMGTISHDDGMIFDTSGYDMDDTLDTTLPPTTISCVAVSALQL